MKKEEVKVEETVSNAKPKKIIIILLIMFISIAILGFGGVLIYSLLNSSSNPIPRELEPLPKPEVAEGREQFGVDKNINEETIDKYLGRSDTVYRDMRMLEDPAVYENIGGDRFLSGYIKGFEVIPLPYIIPVSGLPEEVGNTYEGITLFYEKDGKYIANYKESMDILEKYFPKDKNIFLMCGGGGYASMMKNFLIAMGWDENKLYNIGGYWYYNGKNKVDIKMDNGNLDFGIVPYINIDFSSLTKSDSYRDAGVKVTSISISNKEISSLEEGMSMLIYYSVLPNLASNKEVIWTSSDNKIATVSDTGIVTAVKEGEAIITGTTVDQGKTATCKVTVTKRILNRIDLDDVSKENDEISKIDINSINEKYENKLYDESRELRPEYRSSEAYRALMSERDNELVVQLQKRADVINKLIKDNKSFIIIYRRDTCGDSPYSVIDNGPKILSDNGYTYIEIKEDVRTYHEGKDVLSLTNLDSKKIDQASLVIVKDGEVLVGLDPNITYIYNEDSFRSWLGKYVNLK